MSTSSHEPEIILDLSRLLSRVLHGTPTGVDRCEMAYARGLLTTVPERLQFGAVHPFGPYGRLAHAAVLRFLDTTEATWDRGIQINNYTRKRLAIKTLLSLRPLTVSAPRGSRVYIQPSPNNLIRPQLVRSILQREQAKFVCLVHDLIPLQYPEYAKPGGAALHARRIDTVVRFADGIIANSQATLSALSPYLAHAGRDPAIAVAHLGTHICRDVEPITADRPYFVTIGTIEPRKNHLLLLNLWRRMAETLGADACPMLFVIGRRGWENEQIVDMLERCPALVGCVEELGGLPDRKVQALLAGARALLLPSFAEGYGMPVTEAIAFGTPVICSDLPALREAGGSLPTFLDPLDGPAWLREIQQRASTAGRTGQLLGAASALNPPPNWRDHLATLLSLVQRVAA